MGEAVLTRLRCVSFLAAAAIAAWVSEPMGQEYAMDHGDRVLFWKSDEQPIRSGMLCVLWGYYRVIAHADGMTEFRDVEWCNANE